MNAINKGSVIKGKFIPQDKAKFVKSFQQFEGKSCEVVVRGIKKRRSNNQNSYMWSVVYKLIADYTGYSTNDIHNLMKLKFIPKDVGDEKLPGSTKDLSTIELEEYLQNCRNFAYEQLQINIPLPNEVDYEY